MLTDQDIETLSSAPQMLCMQCEQAAMNKACMQSKGVCSKDADLSALFDLIIAGCFSVSVHARPLVDAGIDLPDHFIKAVTEGAFLTLTNVNFDKDRVGEYIDRLRTAKEEAISLVKESNLTSLDIANEFGMNNSTSITNWNPPFSIEEMVSYGKSEFGIYNRMKKLGATVCGLQELLVYAIKGISAYSTHVALAGGDIKPDGVAIFTVLSDVVSGQRDLLELALELGKANLDTMARLDHANFNSFGQPTFTKVSFGVRKGKAILMSGHDLHDLADLLEATKETGINIYTHGEMLAANSYPKLKEFSHFVGNYGSAWQNQQKEFAAFPGAIVINTNCVMPAKKAYKDRMFTCNVVGEASVTHLESNSKGKKDWSKVIEKALELPGFDEDGGPQFDNFLSEQTIGANHRTTVPLASAVIDLVKTGKLRRVFFVGGCDGSFSQRNYFTEVAEYINEKLPDCVVAGSACGVYRYITTVDFGTLPDTDGFPRLLHLGQCNDTFSGIQLVAAIAKELGAGLNDVPISYFVSWFEQKAVAILLTLLYLGIKNVRLGPRLPAWLTEEALGVLIEKFNIQPIGDAEEDVRKALDGM
ncbi:hypothetical protein P9112_013067 [Eukaryota sp. TZLM1-RC]